MTRSKLPRVVTYRPTGMKRKRKTTWPSDSHVYGGNRIVMKTVKNAPTLVVRKLITDSNRNITKNLVNLFAYEIFGKSSSYEFNKAAENIFFFTTCSLHNRWSFFSGRRTNTSAISKTFRYSKNHSFHIHQTLLDINLTYD